MPKVGMHIVGPDARPQDKAHSDYEQWSSMRSAVVSYGKRAGTIRKDGSGSGSTVSPDSEAVEGITDFIDDLLPAPYDFESLASLHENSSALRQNVDAMMTNIDAFGHSFTPTIDFDNPDIDEVIKNTMIREKLDTIGKTDLMLLTPDDWESIEPTPEAVEARRELWSKISSIEKGVVKSYFESLNPLCPFSELRTETRQGIEIMGNAGWEIIREEPEDVTSKIKEVYYVSFINMWLMKADRKTTTSKVIVRKDDVNFEEIEVDRYFRRFVKNTAQGKVYFKQMGDPRILSRHSGIFYDTIEEMEAEEEGDSRPANELLHWKVNAPNSSYGIPRWVGALLSVMGSRASEEVNFLYFDNKAIPPMVLMVSGGRLAESSVERIQTHLEEQIKGRKNFHKIMVIEALPADAEVDAGGEIEHSGKMRMELRPLVKEMQNDGLFQTYDANNIMKVGRSFRQPSILTGDTRDMNRSTSDTAKALGEEQVYEPQRNIFDSRMDRDFLTTARIHFWKYKSNAPVQRIPNDLVANATKSLREGAITPNECRIILSDAFSMELPRRPEDWANMPPKISQQQARTPKPEAASSGSSPEPELTLAQKVSQGMSLIRRSIEDGIEDAKDDLFNKELLESGDDI